VSVSDVLTADPRLPDRWWERLRDSLATLRTVPTRRINHDQASVSRRAQALLGQPVRVERWETVHGDLHWGNLMRPFGMLDWELWGRGPAGTDAATLFLYALPVPAVAVRVRAVFTDVLDTPVGRVAELVVAARMLARIAGGDYPHMAEPLRHHLKGLGVDLYR
jgi:aminoglycoside phosphotransferase (APT) family kinase protein